MVVDSITQQLSGLVTYVFLKNQCGKFDINTSSEDFFCDLLNLIYDIDLISLNKEKANFPAIDLGDKKKRVCYQITSENNKSKITETVKKFKEHSLANFYEKLVVLIISSDKKRPSSPSEKEFSIEVKGIESVLKDISDISNIDKLRSIDDYINRNLKCSVKEWDSVFTKSIIPAVASMPPNFDLLFNSFSLKYLFCNYQYETSKDILSLYNVLSTLTMQEREFILFIIQNGEYYVPVNQKNEYAYHFFESLDCFRPLPDNSEKPSQETTIFIPYSTIALNFTPIFGDRLFESLTRHMLVKYIDDYATRLCSVVQHAEGYDSLLKNDIPMIELLFIGEAKVNLFVELKLFADNSDKAAKMLPKFILDADFSDLASDYPMTSVVIK